jgi:hypothetical protein
VTKAAPDLCRDAHDLLEVRDLGEIDNTFAADYIETESRVPLRFALERRSDIAFIDELERSASEQLNGLADGSAALGSAVAAAVLSVPSIRMLSRRSDGTAHVLQAVLVQPPASSGVSMALRVVLRAEVDPAGRGGGARVPPAVIRSSIEVELLELDNEHDLAMLVDVLLGWGEEHPVPADPRAHARDTVVFLGNPQALCSDPVPADWRQRLTRTAEAFGMNASIVGDGSKFSGDVPASTVQVVSFDPYGGHAPRVPGDVTTISVPARDRAWRDLEAAVCGVLSRIEPAEEETAPPKVELAPGQKVYHRKVGASRKFDKFDAGSAEPCRHGEGAYIPWHGDKCIKGFQRRYVDFTPSMLRHCGRYPNCNVYAVFA